MTPPVRIAMWSGPRNISTAMMRSWENRPDTVVADEPFYAAYLSRSGIDHPVREAVMASQPTDWRVVARQVSRDPLPSGAAIFYQKHMTHHMLPEIGLEWMEDLRHAFLIRDPREVVASYTQKRAECALADIGVVRQVELFDRVCDQLGTAPPVVDGRDVLGNPRGLLTALCAALKVPFSETMLQWPAGRRDSDGVWAPHWYAAVEASTGFGPPPPPASELPAPYARVAEAALPFYHRLHAHRLHAGEPSASAKR